jgi:predicted RNase H-like nuclease
MHTFIGVDLGWYGKPSGLASIELTEGGLSLQSVSRLDHLNEILHWIESQAGSGNSVVAVDAPLVIRNHTSIRPAEGELNRDFRWFHAGCHPANLGRPFAPIVLGFSRALSALGFLHGADMMPKENGRFQIEVHPHAAAVNLFDLPRIVKYKRGRRDQRARELRRLRKLMVSRLPILDPGLQLTLPPVPREGSLKLVEDQIDAVLCAYIAAHWWFWGNQRNRRYGTKDEGYIVVPDRQPFVKISPKTLYCADLKGCPSSDGAGEGMNRAFVVKLQEN